MTLVGSQVQVYDNVAHAVVSSTTFKSTDTFTIDLPAGQANNVSIALPASAGAANPQAVLIVAPTGSTYSNQVTLVGTTGTKFTLGTTGADTTVAGNGLNVTLDPVQKLTLQGAGGNDFVLGSSTVPTVVVAGSGANTLDFSSATAAVTVNLGLDKGQAQTIAPWNTTLSITGVISKLIGSAYADNLTGGPAATTEIRAGAGNATITGGSGDNILIGGGGKDTLIGGSGRNLIIGGTGNSTIYANGWQNEVFCGVTSYNANDQALLSVLNQGPRFMFSYVMRRALASSATNPTGVFSFQDTGAVDTVYGNLTNNWFMLGKYGKMKG